MTYELIVGGCATPVTATNRFVIVCASERFTTVVVPT